MGCFLGERKQARSEREALDTRHGGRRKEIAKFFFLSAEASPEKGDDGKKEKAANSLLRLAFDSIFLAPVVQKMNNAIHWISLYPEDSAIVFPNTYPLDSDLSSG